MTSEQALEKGWARCIRCGCRRPERKLEAGRCIDVPWCDFVLRRPDVLRPSPHLALALAEARRVIAEREFDAKPKRKGARRG